MFNFNKKSELFSVAHRISSKSDCHHFEVNHAGNKTQWFIKVSDDSSESKRIVFTFDDYSSF